jgi:hypothetical protein
MHGGAVLRRGRAARARAPKNSVTVAVDPRSVMALAVAPAVAMARLTKGCAAPHC